MSFKKLFLKKMDKSHSLNKKKNRSKVHTNSTKCGKRIIKDHQTLNNKTNPSEKITDKQQQLNKGKF